MTVFNQCFNDCDKEISNITGTAVAEDPQYPAALTVSFPDVPAVPGPNYLVHKTDYYSYSLVGSPTKTTLYILSRTPQMSRKLYHHLKHLARKLGYNVDELVLDNNALQDECPVDKFDSCYSCNIPINGTYLLVFLVVIILIALIVSQFRR